MKARIGQSSIEQIKILATKELANKIKTKMSIFTTSNFFDVHNIKEINMKSDNTHIKDIYYK